MQVHATAFISDIFYIFDQFLLTTTLKPSLYTILPVVLIKFALLNINYIQIDRPTVYAKFKSIWIFKLLLCSSWWDLSSGFGLYSWCGSTSNKILTFLRKQLRIVIVLLSKTS